MKTRIPDYSNCIVNLSSSLLKYFGCKPFHETLEVLDSHLTKDYKNVVLLILDGMGKDILDANFAPDGFFNSHMIAEYLSVVPPTTVAATTSYYSALEPVEHGWLGWDLYYKDIDKTVTTFLNIEADTGDKIGFYAARKFTPYKSIVDIINDNGGNAYWAMPFEEPYPDTLEKICQRIQKLCNQKDKKLIVSYWNEPDSTFHEKGCFGPEAKAMCHKVESVVQDLCSRLDDTIVIISADHGHIDCKSRCLEDYPDITECLVRIPSIESRCVSFFVKNGFGGIFMDRFKNHFGDDFDLYSKNEVFSNNLFGTGTPHSQSYYMVGDYIAVAKGDIALYRTRETADALIGQHAGMTVEEMTIPLIIVK